MLHCGSCSGVKSGAASSFSWKTRPSSKVTSIKSLNSCGPNSDQTPHSPYTAARFVHSNVRRPVSYSPNPGALGSNKYGAFWRNAS